MSNEKISYQSLGASGLKVSKLWLGTMMFGDHTDEAEAARIVASAREAGINAIDTANAYVSGESERITGRLISADRSHWVLATKVANVMGPGPNDRGLSRRHIMHHLKNNLLLILTLLFLPAQTSGSYFVLPARWPLLINYQWQNEQPGYFLLFLN